VLDEASMIDLPMLHAILRHMPEGARLLLTGDAAQLPPIGFGLVYHALVSDAQITANLTVIHRQAPESGIPTVSAAIRERRMPLFTDYQGVADGVSFVACESGLIGDVVERIVLQLGGYSNGVLVVSPTKKGPGGVDALNARLHERLRSSEAPAHEVKGFNAQYYTIGDPVMWLRNDYSRGLFNGQIGQVKSIPDSLGERTRDLAELFQTLGKPRVIAGRLCQDRGRSRKPGQMRAQRACWGWLFAFRRTFSRCRMRL
jgi:exodeoxyribonuclease V alpha subunit